MKTAALTAFLLASTIFTGPAWAAINAADFGVTPGAADNGVALQRAFDAARNTSDRTVVLPGGNIAYGRQLTANGVWVSGSSSTVLAPSDPYNQRITLTGDSPSLSNVRINYHPVARSGSDHGRNGVWIEGATNFNVSGVTFDGAAYGVPPRGQGAGDLFVYNSQGGTLRDNSLSYTWADAIHITGGSRNIDVTGNRVDHSGDDGIAVVNYRDGTGGVRINGNTVTNNIWGRGITAVGSSDVQIQNNMISGNEANLAGVYVASEPAYNTDVPRN
jgi:parallel beta-helix repeat protein